jgi:hypothetical protein
VQHLQRATHTPAAELLLNSRHTPNDSSALQSEAVTATLKEAMAPCYGSTSTVS